MFRPRPASTAPGGNNPIYGAARSGGAAARAENGSTSPINPTSILPGNLEGFSSAGSRVDSSQLDQFEPRTTNDALTRVPGVNVINDDGFARHGGIGIRGSPPRRGRKVLHLEDGQPINMSVWIDPSVHYIPPLDRVESIEVLRGTVITQGPLNNHGVVNFRNLSPFGPNETEIGASIGYTEMDSRGGGESDDDRWGPSNTRHFHTRQGIGNVGLVFSYSGAEVDGAWDTERLRYNDFYGAIGWKGINSDLTFTAVHFRQRDNYDEANLEGEEDGGFGNAEAAFFGQFGHCKTCFNPGSVYNTYNADVTKLQLVHNYYADDTTTITSRIYGFDHRRDRYQNFQGGDPGEAAEEGLSNSPVIVDDEIFVPEGSMIGRLRTYGQVGAEVRAEFADRPFIGGLRQTIQTGVRYEFNDFTNRNFFGDQDQILEDGDEDGLTTFRTHSDANAISAFLQSTIHFTKNLDVTPGLRLEHYRVSRLTTASTIEEGEGEEIDDDKCEDETDDAIEDSDCFEIGGFDGERKDESFDKTHVLPGISFAYSAFFKSTIYGGYHRGLTTGVLREPKAAFPPTDELGDNFQVGLRSSAIRGVTFDFAAFHHSIENFQIKGASTDGQGDNIYGTLDKVHINGFEVYGRVDGRAYTGGPLNVFFEGNYTLSDAKIREGSVFACVDEDCDDVEEVDVAGNLVPEVYKHFANLTLGVEHQSGWDASVSWTYRGAFFTDEENTAFGADPEGEDGEVPDVWLLSARIGYKIPNTGASVFLAGDNLTDELYIADREDGIKPGQGRTVWAGFKYRFN